MGDVRLFIPGTWGGGGTNNKKRKSQKRRLRKKEMRKKIKELEQMEDISS